MRKINIFMFCIFILLSATIFAQTFTIHNRNLVISSGNVTADYFSGLFLWFIASDSTSYLSFNNSHLSFNESKLNETIDARAEGTIPHTLNGSNHTGNLDGNRVVKYTGFLSNTDHSSILETILATLSFASHLGTADGENDGYVDWFSETNVKLPVNVSACSYNLGSWSAGDTQGATTDSSPDAITGYRIRDLRNESNVTLYVNSINKESVLADGTTDAQNGGTYVDLNDKTTNELGEIDGKIDLNNIPLSDSPTGYKNITVTHNIAGTVYSDSIETFYDAQQTPSMGSVTVGENTLSSSKYTSGIRYYSDNDIIDVNISSTTNLFRNTYRTDHMIWDCTFSEYQGGTRNIDYDSAGVSGVNNPPECDDSATYQNNFTIGTSSRLDIDARVGCRYRKPFSTGSYSYQPASPDYLLNTYPDSGVSTAVRETFFEENYRLPPGDYDSVPGSITGQWTSSNCVGNSNATVFDDAVGFYQTDFTSGYMPAQSCDYSGYSGDQTYYRAIYDAASGHSTGTLELVGLTASDLGTNVHADIKLPTQSGWLNLSCDYNDATFTGVDGDCVQAGDSGDDFSWNVGTLTTSDSGNMYIVRLTFPSTSKKVDEIEERGW